MTAKRTKRVARNSPAGPGGESGLPGEGRGRTDDVGKTGVYPAAGPYPSGPAELRTPADFVHGQTDAEGRPVEGGSGLTYFEGRVLLGGTTPPSSSAPGGVGHEVTDGGNRSRPARKAGSSTRRTRGGARAVKTSREGENTA